MHFSSLNILLHQEALQELMKFAMDTQNDLNEIMNSKIIKIEQEPSKPNFKSNVSKQISEIGTKSSMKFGE